MHTQLNEHPEEASDQFKLGWRYLDGDGVPVSGTMAAYWFEKSAEQGYSDAMTMMILIYLRGIGGTQSNELAYHWAARAHNSGDAMSTSFLAEFYTFGVHVNIDLEKAISLYQEAAAKGHEPSQILLKKLRLKKPRKVPSSYDTVMDANLAITRGDVRGHFAKQSLAHTMSKKKFTAANEASMAQILGL